MMRHSPQAASRRKYYSRYLAHYTKKNHGVLLLGALFLAGVALGTLLVRTAGSDTMELLFRMVGGFVERRREQTMMENFTSSALSSMAIVAALFILGFCAVSQPIVAGLPLFRGLGFGFSTASLYAAYGPGAVRYVGVFLLPGMILSTIAILFCCVEALRLSTSIWRNIRSREREGESGVHPLRLYAARFVALSILCLLSAFVEAAIYAAFANVVLLG